MPSDSSLGNSGPPATVTISGLIFSKFKNIFPSSDKHSLIKQRRLHRLENLF